MTGTGRKGRHDPRPGKHDFRGRQRAPSPGLLSEKFSSPMVVRCRPVAADVRPIAKTNFEKSGARPAPKFCRICDKVSYTDAPDGKPAVSFRGAMSDRISWIPVNEPPHPVPLPHWGRGWPEAG